MASNKKSATSSKAPRKKKPVEQPEIVAPFTAVEVPPPSVSAETDAIPTPDLTEADQQIYRQPAALLGITLLLGWCFDYLFWQQSVGVNFSIFMSLSLIGGLGWLFFNGLRPSRRTLWLILPFLLFNGVTFLRQEPLTSFLAFIFSLLTAGVFTISYLGGRWLEYELFDYVTRFFRLAGNIFLGALIFITKAQSIQARLDDSRVKFPVWAVARGLLFALPILICFGSLLAAGDLVFKEKLDNFLELDDLTENIFRGILILFYAYALSGVFVHSALHSQDTTLSDKEKPVFSRILGFPETAVILASVSLLFFTFVIVQFQYFFGGETNIGVKGFTYSQYARRGFNELITVAFFSLVLLLGLNAISRRDTSSQRKVFSGLSIVLVSMVLVILVSAYQRVALSIGWHGYSRLRLYPQIFLLWLGALFVTVVVLELLRKERYFTLAALVASVGFAISLTFMNVDAAIIKHNVPRTLQGKNLNVGHLASLSADAVPALVEEFRSKAYPVWVHEGVGATLTCYLYFDDYEASLDDWRSFNFARWSARNALNDVEPFLQEYGIKTDRYPVTVRTPSNVLYECREKAVDED